MCVGIEMGTIKVKHRKKEKEEKYINTQKERRVLIANIRLKT